MTCHEVLSDALPAGEAVETVHHVHLEPAPRVVAAARAFVSEHAPELSVDARDALLLLTSELVTNAVIHARTPLEVGITVSSGSVLVTVHDLDLTRPTQQPYSEREREGGWGLGLVHALAADSALARHPEGGKTAWFRLDRDADDPTPAGGAA